MFSNYDKNTNHVMSVKDCVKEMDENSASEMHSVRKGEAVIKYVYSMGNFP
jgi:hypothetical protein